MECLVLCINGFFDLQIYPSAVKPNDAVWVSENTARRMKQSDDSVEVVERRLKVNKEVAAKVKRGAK